MNSILSVPNMYSCAMDTFLEVSSHLFLPYLSTLTVRNEFTELLFNTCKRYIESQGNDRMLREIRKPIWVYLQQHCPSFLARDSNACFGQIFEERTFGDLSSKEMNIFSSQRIFESFCKTCHDSVALKSSILVNYVTRSALHFNHNIFIYFFFFEIFIELQNFLWLSLFHLGPGKKTGRNFTYMNLLICNI